MWNLLPEQLRNLLRGPAGLVVLDVAVGGFLLLAAFTAQRFILPEAGVLPLLPGEFVQGEFLVKFRPGTPAEDIRSFHAELNAPEIELIPRIGVSRRQVPDGFSVGEMVDRYRRNPNVEYAEPNFLAAAEDNPNDPWYSSTQWNLQKVGAPAAWDLSKGSPSVVVAVVDTGVTANHEDLSSKLVAGYSFVDGTTNTSDAHGHGTAVSGMVGPATNNGKGIAGLAQANPIMALKVADASGSTSYSHLANAMIYAADNGASVINISMGGTASSDTLQDAADYAWGRGLVIVAAAGNSGGPGIYYPAAANHVVAVGATDAADGKATFSSTGPELDLMAPGVGVYSTVKTGGYLSVSGTSHASPQVAALAALLRSANPSLSNQQLVDIMTSTAVDLGAGGKDSSFGYGRIDAAKALQTALGAGGAPSPTPAPTVTATSTSAATSTPAATAIPTATPVPATATTAAAAPTTAPTAAASPTSAPTATAASAATATVSASGVRRTETFTGRVEARGSAEVRHNVTLAAPGAISASLNWPGNADLDFFLLSPSGQQVASNTARGKPITINFTANAAGTYAIRVVAVSGQANYTLTVTHP